LREKRNLSGEGQKRKKVLSEFEFFCWIVVVYVEIIIGMPMEKKRERKDKNMRNWNVRQKIHIKFGKRQSNKNRTPHLSSYQFGQKESYTKNQTHKQKICIECGEKKKYEYLHALAKNSYQVW